MQDVAVVGLDLAKRFFHVVGMDDRGKVVLRRRCTRSQLFGLFEKLPKVRVGMEACGSAHFFGRRLSELGHDARLIPAQFVKPFLKSQKNDDLDAEAGGAMPIMASAFAAAARQRQAILYDPPHPDSMFQRTSFCAGFLLSNA